MWSLLFAGCVPTLSDNTPYVTEPRVLAVRVEPPEVEPRTDVTVTALYADATGALADAPVDWASCTALKPLAELGPVAQSCLDPGSDSLVAMGRGVTATGPVPDDACSRFGPNPPPSVDGLSSGRPTDPDVTGGYYQPILGFPDGDDPTLVATRIRCGLPYVTQETYVAWNLGYHSNANPALAGVAVDGVDLPEDGAGEPPTVAAGSAVTFTAAWPACPDTPACGDGMCTAGEDLSTCPEDCEAPVGCGGAESYVVYDADTALLTTRREAISATWFTTGGTFDEARNGRAGDDSGTSVENGWTAPDAPGEVWLAVVLRDERGGVDFKGYRVSVGP